jgi:hypothetical protein
MARSTMRATTPTYGVLQRILLMLGTATGITITAQSTVTTTIRRTGLVLGVLGIKNVYFYDLSVTKAGLFFIIIENEKK